MKENEKTFTEVFRFCAARVKICKFFGILITAGNPAATPDPAGQRKFLNRKIENRPFGRRRFSAKA